MWPSTPSFTVFGTTPCPGGRECSIPNCLFSHHTIKTPSAGAFERDAKRLKIDDSSRKAYLDALRAKRSDPSSPKPELSSGLTPQNDQEIDISFTIDRGMHSQASSKDSSQPAAPNAFVGSIARKGAQSPLNKVPSLTRTALSTAKPNTASQTTKTLPQSATRPISPPLKSVTMKPAPAPETKVSLMPRKLAKEPAAFTKRLTLLQTLRKYMAELNDKVAQSNDPETKLLHLTDNQLNKLAVDEEENMAVQNLAVYENVLKQRLVALKKADLATWITWRRAAVAKENEAKGNGGKAAKKPLEPVDTGLKPNEEVILLSRLLSKQSGLSRFGYVTEVPTDEAVEETRRALNLAGFWEICDRCNTRFQVFPERRQEDGALTTGGKCIHHWGKPIRPKKTAGQMPGPTTWGCCKETMGTSQGCTTSDTHVFKVSEVKRLASIMQFRETPPNDNVEPNTAICFDCEMGYTTNGLELMRLTAVAWPSHKPLIDVLVRPLGHILDLNTRFSGIHAEQYFNAAPHDPAHPVFDSKDLRIVDSPYAARELFLSHLSPDTFILGHALENDLNTIRVVHPKIVDTVILFPHPAGLPVRNSLRNLTRIHLGLEIQQGGAAGHDSFEDARATGELVRFKVAQEWKKLKRDGWFLKEDGLFPPMPSGPPAASLPVVKEAVMTKEPEHEKKRKFEEFDEGGDSHKE